LHAVPTSRPRLALLDGLRFVAAFAVMMFHFTARKPEQVEAFPALSQVTIYGSFGVHLFFMISGFVILMTAWRSDLSNFVASRVARLFPAYWVCVLLTAAVILVVRPDVLSNLTEKISPKTVLLNLTMAQSSMHAPNVDGVYWTLWIELIFYLLVGVLILIGLTRQRVLAFVFLWPVLGQIAHTCDSRLLVNLLIPDYASLFCIGMAVFLVHRDGWSVLTGLALAFNLFFVAQLTQSKYAPSSVSYDELEVSSTVVFAIVCGGLAVLILIACTPLGRVAWKPLSFAGLLTYPLYLIHENVGWWLLEVGQDDLGLSPGTAVAAVVMIMIGVATLVHLGAERTLGPRLRRAVDRDLRRAPDVVPSSSTVA